MPEPQIEIVELGSSLSVTFDNLPSGLINAILTIGNADGSVPINNMNMGIESETITNAILTALPGAGNYAGVITGTLSDGSPLESYRFLLAYGTNSSLINQNNSGGLTTDQATDLIFIKSKVETLPLHPAAREDIIPIQFITQSQQSVLLPTPEE